MISTASTDIIEAIEQNQGEFRLSLARSRKAEEYNSDRIKWIIGKSPSASYNCVVDVHLAPDDADDAIKQSIRKFQAHKVSGSWQIGESMQPQNLGERLESHGFIHTEDIIGMALDLQQTEISPIRLPGLRIRKVTNRKRLKIWIETMMSGFGKINKEAARWYTNALSRAGYTNNCPWCLFIGYLDGKPVTASSLFIGSNACGVYLIATLPEARHKGIGKAITNAAMLEAKRRKQELCVLQATKMGLPVYQKLGFEELCTMSFYLWKYKRRGL